MKFCQQISPRWTWPWDGRILVLLFYHCSWVLMKAKRETNWKVWNKGLEICWCCTVCSLLRSSALWAHLHHLVHVQWERFNSKTTDWSWLCQLAYLESPEWIGFRWMTYAVFQKDVQLQLVGDPSQWLQISQKAWGGFSTSITADLVIENQESDWWCG